MAALAEMNRLNEKHIVWFITAFTHGDGDDKEHYVVFEWADGGNLGDLWKKYREPELSEPQVKWVVEQLHGLAQALDAAHYLDRVQSYRHGDLKPANILWFLDGSGYGTLKIGDWGEAKNHTQITSLRPNTTGRPSTRRYQPPEVRDAPLTEGERHVRSRLYDIWSFGCITLEFIIWLVYGWDQLNRFNNAFSDTYYVGESPSHKVHDEVLKWMNHLAKYDLFRPGKSALGDLLQIVRTGLLVVQLPENGGAKPGTVEETEVGVTITVAEPAEPIAVNGSAPERKERLRADQLEHRLKDIVQVERRPGYWYQAQALKPPVISDRSQNLLVSPTPKQGVGSLSASLRNKTDYGHPPLDPGHWKYIIDNKLSATLLSKLDCSILKQSPMAVKLCIDCQGFRKRLGDMPAGILYNIQKLQENAKAKACDLCCLLWQACESVVDQKLESIQVRMADSTLSFGQAKNPALVLCQDNGKSTSYAHTFDD